MENSRRRRLLERINQNHAIAIFFCLFSFCYFEPFQLESSYVRIHRALSSEFSLKESVDMFELQGICPSFVLTSKYIRVGCYVPLCRTTLYIIYMDMDTRTFYL